MGHDNNGGTPQDGLGYTFTCPCCGCVTTLEAVQAGVLEIFPIKTLSKGDMGRGTPELGAQTYGESYTSDGDRDIGVVFRCRSCDHEFDGETLDSMEEKGWLKVYGNNARQPERLCLKTITTTKAPVT